MAGRGNFPFKQIAAQALLSAETLLGQWLSDGRRNGHEYSATNPLRADKKRGSFSINLNTGAWGDFATDDKGGDLISLYAYLNGMEQLDAAVELADLIGYRLDEKLRPKEKGERKAPVIDPATVKNKAPAQPSAWTPVLPVPYDAGEPPKAHVKRGIPERVWEYRDDKGRLLGFIYRFITSDGGKETLPLVWGHHVVSKAEEWRWMQFPEPRPLYGLDRLAAKPDAWVLLVEGEKCADAPVELLPNAVVVSWPGGSKATSKVDWRPLIGRNIYAWPDCDFKRETLTRAEKAEGVSADDKPILPEDEQPGMKAMLQIRDALSKLDDQLKFKIVDIPKPGEKPDGWDIADAIEEGMDGPKLLAMIRRVRAEPAPEPVDAPPPISADELHTAFPAIAEEGDEDAWRWRLAEDKKGIMDTRENVFVFLDAHPALKGLIAFDKFALRIVKRQPAPWDVFHTDGSSEWSDNDNLELSLWLSTMYGFTVRSLDTINQAVKLIAGRNAFDPLLDYLEGLAWDGNERIRTWLTDFAGVESSEYSRLVGELFLISMVARAYKPGCIMRAMPVFEGRQFRGKSSVARILAGEFFSDSPLDLRGKDGFINIQGTWLHEIAELGSFNNQEAPIIKAYLSSAVDRYRSPFDKYARDWPRRTVFFGTTNEDVYLRDKTGNTRFWPLRTEVVGDIDLEGLQVIRDQLLAEAVVYFKQGKRWHPTNEEQQRLFAPEQNLREYDDPWEERISSWLRLETFTATSVSDVLDNCLKIEPGKQTQANAIQVGKILTRLGWKKTRPDASDKGGKRPRMYERPKDEVLPTSSSAPAEIENDESIPF